MTLVPKVTQIFLLLSLIYHKAFTFLCGLVQSRAYKISNVNNFFFLVYFLVTFIQKNSPANTCVGHQHSYSSIYTVIYRTFGKLCYNPLLLRDNRTCIWDVPPLAWYLYRGTSFLYHLCTGFWLPEIECVCYMWKVSALHRFRSFIPQK